MAEFSRDAAMDRVEEILETVENERMPVPIREIWTYGDLALGLDPVERLDVYVTKEVLVGGDAVPAEFDDRPGVDGIGETVRAEWAESHPTFVRTNANGHVAPERCLAAHLLSEDEPIHLEVCNASFEDNVTQRLQGARALEEYERILDPRGVCLWIEGKRSEEAVRKLREGELVFPTLARSLEMLGMDEGKASEAADVLAAHRADRDGATVRGDVV